MKAEQRYLDVATGEALEPHRMLKYAALGDTKIILQPNEAKDMRVVSPPDSRGLTLLGFKPITAILP